MKKIKVGPSFSESIYTDRAYARSGNYSKSHSFSMRGFLIPLLFCICALLIVFRIFYLQIIKGQDNRLLSDQNRTRTTIIHAPRGIIFDRNNNPLVYNIPGFRKVINGKTVLLTQKEALPLLEINDKDLSIDTLRSYPYKDAISHLLGYVGQISIDDLKNPLFKDYNANDVIGQMGIEEQYEPRLKGIDGKKLTEVDATGKTVRVLGQTDPIPGQNITLTIDASFQKKVFDAMKDISKGAAIVEKPNGEILSIVSKPSFDPNLFTLGKHYVSDPTAQYNSLDQILLDSNGQPLLNRAISGLYPPGSTFKLIVAASGLESGAIDSNYTVVDNGTLKIGDFSFANWYFTEYGRTEGEVNVVKAIARSNDIFFYKLGDLLGVDKISETARKFGLGDVLGIDLPGESKGLLPTKEWKKKTLGEDWYLGDNYHYGIGQGYLLTTPLQVNAWTQAIANGGTLYRPHLLNDPPDALRSAQAMAGKKGFLKKETVDLIQKGMVLACSPGGVAWPLFNFKIPLACKTGTAEHGNGQDKPHAWITVIAPAINPQIIITVLAESSGEGSNVAGPIAKKILEAWFGGN